MGFSALQGVAAGSSSTVASFTVTLTSNPTAGNLVCVGASVGSGANTLSAISVKDGAGTPNNYTISTHTPFKATNIGTLILAYFVANSSANKSITVSWSGGSAFVNVYVEEFSVSGGTPVFDKDTTNDVTITGTTYNNMSITPANPNSLLWVTASPDNGGFTAPTNGSTLSGWTGGPDNGGTQLGSEYILSATGANSCAFTDSLSGDICGGMAMAFSLFSPDELPWAVNSAWPIEPIVSVW